MEHFGKPLLLIFSVFGIQILMPSAVCETSLLVVTKWIFVLLGFFLVPAFDGLRSTASSTPDGA